VNDFGKRIHFYLNYSSDAQSFAYTYGPGTDLLAGKIATCGERIALPPWGAAIVEEK
jgi:beta-galactosidase